MPFYRLRIDKFAICDEGKYVNCMLIDCLLADGEILVEGMLSHRDILQNGSDESSTG
jgi:hypothetical protein